MDTGHRPISVVLADHNLLIRQGLRRILEEQGNMAIVGEARNAQEALALVQELSPDVLLINVGLPHLGGIPTIRRVKQAAPQTEVVAISAEAGDQVMAALEAGAAGYLLADTEPETLLRVIRGARDGELIMAARPFPGRSGRGTERRTRRFAEGKAGHLSAREMEILQEIAQGATDREIAAHLTISEATVKTHIRSILKKVKARNRAHAVARFLGEPGDGAPGQR
ncbi:MAG: response regulator transcription factor [Armatimonadetes bacterium]|nr:response regulator transcription factor [Armatimonadota bacterium]